MSDNIHSVCEFVVPFLVERGKPVNRTKIKKFLRENNVHNSRSFRAVFDDADGMMNNFIKQYERTMGSEK